MHKRTFAQERRASARRGSQNRTLCGCNRAMFDDDRSDNQERRALARRGSQNRTLCGCNRAMFDDDRTDDQERRALARRGSVNRALCGRNRVLFGDDRTYTYRERRALRPPWFWLNDVALCGRNRRSDSQCGRPTTRPRAAGVSPPCRRSVLAIRKGISATSVRACNPTTERDTRSMH
jgi:hypothetical protein